MSKIREKPAEKSWVEFKKKESLNAAQLKKFQKYAELLLEWNEDINLTSIKNLAGVVRQHFLDSLALIKFIDFKKVNSIADIGTGAGFPALPLKIIFTDLKVYLIEVTKKKQKFLKTIVEELNLKKVEIIDFDWRTFLRKTQFDIDIFVTRAALDDYELCRMFRETCFYKDKKLIYWGTSEWEPHLKNERYLKDAKSYKLGKKERKLFFFEKN
ncbi:16S rRNA (guanine(527)-N(7))-methyltransferase RsmG [Candidatus Dependentiae bacterium]|nr:16S rRNA (guanine(527)-N(7))-methyltransferase RsmG [Candidatus Dependentiae bacterium]